MRTLIIFCFLAFLCSCSENDRLVYDENRHDIYYSIVNKTRDSIYVSLLTVENVLTTTIEVKLLGDVLPSPRKFKVEVVKEKTQAKEGIHYKTLPEFFEFPANEFTYKMPVELIRGDLSIKEKPVVLTLRLTAGPDLGIAYTDRSEVRLIIADMLKAPEGEGYFGDMTIFKKLFGEYSKKKHMMIIELTGHDFWDGGYGNYGGVYGLANEQNYYLPYARKLYKIVTENEIKDENGKIIQGWMVP